MREHIKPEFNVRASEMKIPQSSIGLVQPGTQEAKIATSTQSAKAAEIFNPSLD
jgi:hypothetical protein